jgi:hypothetical protein
MSKIACDSLNSVEYRSVIRFFPSAGKGQQRNFGTTAGSVQGEVCKECDGILLDQRV